MKTKAVYPWPGQARAGENQRGGPGALKEASASSPVPDPGPAAAVTSASVCEVEHAAGKFPQQQGMLFREEKRYGEII